MTGCKTNKRRFGSDVEAQAALAAIRKRPHDVIPGRFYWCGFCSGFHLTSGKSYGVPGVKDVKLKYRKEFEKYLL